MTGARCMVRSHATEEFLASCAEADSDDLGEIAPCLEDDIGPAPVHTGSTKQQSWCVCAALIFFDSAYGGVVLIK